jgi:ribonuclease HI
MSFDGAASKKGAGADIWIRPPVGKPDLLSYKLNFKCTNNVAEYEALILGLKALKDFQSQRINIQGDSELVIKQVQGSYQAKHPRLRSYRNLVLDLMEGFKERQLIVIPRGENYEANALVVLASMLQVPENANEHYQIEVRHRPLIPNNVEH